MEPRQERQLPTFRTEALAHRSRTHRRPQMIELSAPWTNWAFYSVIGLFLAALVALSIIEIDRFATGAAAITPDRKVVVLVPAVLAPEVDKGNPVEFGSETAAVESFEGNVLYPSEIRERFRVEVTVPSVVVVTSARPRQADGATARVLVESQRAIVALVPGLKALFEGSDA